MEHSCPECSSGSVDRVRVEHVVEHYEDGPGGCIAAATVERASRMCLRGHTCPNTSLAPSTGSPRRASVTTSEVSSVGALTGAGTLECGSAIDRLPTLRSARVIQ
jgi:hypothetical protein